MTVEDGRKRLGELVKSRRLAAYGTIEAAIRKADVNRQTWERVETGAKVWDSKLTSIAWAVGLVPDVALHYLKTGEGFDALEAMPPPTPAANPPDRANLPGRFVVDGPGGSSSADLVYTDEATGTRRVVELKRLSDGAIIAAIRGVTESDNMSAEERIEAIRTLIGSEQGK